MENPFIITGNIPEKYFCDRREESKKVIRTLSNGGDLCMISPRRMGKSKLVRFCYDKPEIADNYYTFYIDILHTSSLREFTYLFGQKVFETLNTKSRKAFMALVQGLRSINAKFGFDPITATPTFSLELGDISHPEFTLAEIFLLWKRRTDRVLWLLTNFSRLLSIRKIILRHYFVRISSIFPMYILSLPVVNAILLRRCFFLQPDLFITVRR